METAVERQALLPCPFCGCDLVPNTNQADMMVRRYGTHYDHPQSLCHLSEHEVRPIEVEDWNRRAAPPIAPGEREPRWICLEGMNVDELAAYDYGCASMQAALQSILDGKDSGEGAANEPWESVRRRVIALVRAAKAQAPAEPAGFDRTTALLLLSAASKSGNEGAIRFAAQLAGATQCHGCGYVNFHCRCAAPKAPAENTSTTEGVRADAAVLLGKEIEELIATEFGITGGTIHSKVNKLVVLAAGKAPTPGAQDKDAFCWREFCRMVMDTDRNNEHGYLALMKLIEHGYEMDVRIAGLAEAGKAPAQPSAQN